jgi:endonuclease YncB( thermonuclease family)
MTDELARSIDTYRPGRHHQRPGFRCPYSAAVAGHARVMRRLLAIVLAVFVAMPALAQRVVDGDTLAIDGTTYRLEAFDAPEAGQTCDGGTWLPGPLATAALVRLIAERPVECRPVTRDRYGRTVARCYAGGDDLSALMVAAGWGWAFRRYSVELLPIEAEAKAHGLGVHAHDCVPPWEWRAARRQ